METYNMKIVMINGSPRKNGATAKILHAFEKELGSMKGTEVTFLNVSELDIKPCLGCTSCYKSGKCCINDDGDRISELIGSADGIIMGSPTYASNVSGQLKQLIDRGHFVIEQLLVGKYAVSVATGENYGNKDAGKVIDNLLGYSGAMLSGKIRCNIPFDGDPCNEKMKARIRKTARNLYADIAGRRKHPVQSIVHGVIFGFGIRPFVRAKGEAYRGVTEKWRQNGIKV